MRTIHFHRVVAVALIASVGPSLASTASAAPPTGVNIEVPTLFDGTPASFQASGPAVDSGAICSSGTVQNVTRRANGGSPPGINFHVLKEFTCSDGDTFQIKLEVRVDRKGDNFRWVVTSGTGRFARLHGTGAGIGMPLPAGSPDGVLDKYDG